MAIEKIHAAAAVTAVALMLLATLGLSNTAWVQVPQQIETKGQVTQDQPNARTRTSIEGTISSDEVGIKIEQEQSYSLPEITNPLNDVNDAISTIDETKDQILDGIGIIAE